MRDRADYRLFYSLLIIWAVLVVAVMSRTSGSLPREFCCRVSEVDLRGIERDDIRQFDAEFRKMFRCVGENIMIENPSPQEKARFIAPNSIQLLSANNNGSRPYTFGTQHEWSDAAIREVKFFGEIVRPRFSVETTGAVGCWGCTTILPSSQHLFVHPFAISTEYFLSPQNKFERYKSSLGDAGCFVYPVGHLYQLAREKYENSSKNCSPHGRLVFEKRIPKVAAKLALFVLSVICFIFGIGFCAHGIECRKWRICLCAIVVFLVGWYLSGIYFQLAYS